jgi:hypothetical protein
MTAARRVGGPSITTVDLWRTCLLRRWYCGCHSSHLRAATRRQMLSFFPPFVSHDIFLSLLLCRRSNNYVICLFLFIHKSTAPRSTEQCTRMLTFTQSSQYTSYSNEGVLSGILRRVGYCLRQVHASFIHPVANSSCCILSSRCCPRSFDGRRHIQRANDDVTILTALVRCPGALSDVRMSAFRSRMRCACGPRDLSNRQPTRGNKKQHS